MGYDTNSRITSLTTPDGTSTLSYDHDGQLTSASLTGESYAYDANGNRTAATTGTSVSSPTVSTGADDCLSSDANSFNRSMTRRFGLGSADYEIHEIVPVKFAGSPTAMSNKVGLLDTLHSEVTTWFGRLQRLIER